MKNVTYISAGAGSGKTFTLTHRLADMIRKGEVRPNEVILTTFTKKAAENFKERAQSVLYKEGMYDEAAELDNAMIGTVHSVASLFIQKYWYYLGLSPELGIMAEEDVDFYISQSMADLATPEHIRKLNRFREEFGFTDGFASTRPDYDYWKKALQRVVDYSISHDVMDFSDSLAFSLRQAQEVFQPKGELKIDKRRFEAALDELEEAFRAEKKETAAKQNRLAKAKELRSGLAEIRFRWIADFADLISKKLKSSETPLADELYDSLQGIWHSQNVYDLVADYIRLIFDFAQRWRTSFEAFKREKHLIDYNDMEKYMFKLLKNEEVAKDIRDSYKVLFVDEFQDSSPIQVKIFDRLSDLVACSCWVGDQKQAIYGFRGSDTELTQAVAGIVESGANGCNSETLDTSYRSDETLVKVSNALFCRVFSDILPPDKVALKPHETDKTEHPLLVWEVSSKSNEYLNDLADRIEDLLKTEDPSNVAVLARKNTELDNLAAILRDERNIPVNRENGELLACKETELLNAVLSLIVDNSNELAKAKIAYLTEPECTIGQIIDSKLEYNEAVRAIAEDERKNDWLNNISLVDRTLKIRGQLQRQSVGALVESAITELALRDVVCQWGDGEKRAENLSTLIEVARAYDDRCLQLSLAATVPGYLNYLSQCQPMAAGDSKGIQLLTYHGAKGLEWKVTILLSLDNDPIEENGLIRRGFFEVQTVREEAPTVNNLYPEMMISLLPWTFGSKKTVPDDFRMRVVESETYKRLRSATLAESARLLYVGVTRPQQVLILAVKNKSGLQWVEKLDPSLVTERAHFEGMDLLHAGIAFHTPSYSFDEEEPLMAAEEEESYGYPVLKLDRPIQRYPKRNIEPSDCHEQVGEATLLHNTGKRIMLRASAEEMTEIGSCIHDIFCVLDQAGASVVNRIVEGYGLGAKLPDTEGICMAWHELEEYLLKSYGPAIHTYHELGFKQWINGQVVTGSMDFVYETADGVVVVDYKTYPGSDACVTDPENKHYAGIYKDQLACYQQALCGQGLKVLDRLIYYPVSGLILRVQ